LAAVIWRAVALTVIAAAVIFVVYDTLQPGPADFGFRTANPNGHSTRTQRVVSVVPGSTAARAGIKAGDSISTGETPLARAYAFYAPVGSRIPVVVNGNRTVLLLGAPSPFQTILIVPLIIRLAFLAVAALLAWRRPNDASARALTLFLLCYGLLIGMPNTTLPTPLLSIIVVQTGSALLLLLGTGAAATFAAIFPSGTARPLPAQLARVAQLLTALAIALTVAGTLLSSSERAVAYAYPAITALFLASALLVVAILAVAYAQGVPSERERRRWVFLMLGLALVAVLIDIGVQTTVGYSEIVDNAALLFIGVIPFGLAYAILRHRVIDVGFVLNRAIVYGAVSLIIVGSFMIVETLMSTYVTQHSPAGSMAVQIAAALALGFSIRYIHTRTDHVVDRLFFRQRYLDEAALADFTYDAQYISDAGVLVDRCLEMTLRHAHASDAGIWLRDESGLYFPQRSTFAHGTPVDENDPALVAMRARRVVVDLRAAKSALPGAFGFPMIVRGNLAGALVCGAKKLEEAYAPDETASLRNMAAAVGHALDAVRIRELEERVRALEGVR
jgi:hypothetical protein